MTELDKITTTVPASSLNPPKEQESKTVEDLYQEIINSFKLNLEENHKFSQGIATEKLNRSQLLKMMLEIIVMVIDESKKPNSNDKNDDALYHLNKKIARDLAFSLFGILNNYSYNDRLAKLNLLGKLLQSLHGSR